MLSVLEVKCIFEGVKNKRGWQADIDVETGKHGFIIEIRGVRRPSFEFQISLQATAEEVRKDAEKVFSMQP